MRDIVLEKTKFPEPGLVRAGLLTLFVHVLFAVLLFFGLNWKAEMLDQSMEVEIWRDLPQPSQPPQKIIEPIKPNKPKVPERAPEPVKKKAISPEVKEPVPVKKPEITLAEKKRKQEQEKIKVEKLKQEELKKKQEEELEKKQKAQKEKQEQEALEKKKKEAQKLEREKQAKIEKEKAAQQEKARIEKQKQLEQAELIRQRAAGQARIKSEIAQFKAKILAKIKSRIVMPPDIPGNPSVEFMVTVLPGGDILDARLLRSSGHESFDRAVERAIFLSKPLPLPEDPSLFNEFRNLNITAHYQE